MIDIEELLQRAMDQGASDVHISAWNSPQMRMDGRLIQLEGQILLEEDMEYLIQIFLNDSQRKYLEETGEIETAFSTAKIGRCRVHIFQQRGCYSAIFRLFGNGVPEVEKILLPPSVLELYKEKQGLIIVSGAAGSGRTTTLAVLIEQINQKIGGHILTLESPIEYLYSVGKAMIHQREIGMDTINYNRALKAALKEDVDVILVGDMSDGETIKAMITAAEMGHLVFGVMDAVGAVQTVEQMVETFLPEQQKIMRIRLARVLRAVVFQQLIPTSSSGKRQGVFDVMYANMTIKDLICEGKIAQIEKVMQIEEEMQRMDDGIYDLYIQGEIDRKQALHYVRNISLLEKKLL